MRRNMVLEFIRIDPIFRIRKRIAFLYKKLFLNLYHNIFIVPTPKIGFSTCKVQSYIYIQYKRNKRKRRRERERRRKKTIWVHLIIEIWYENVGIQR